MSEHVVNRMERLQTEGEMDKLYDKFRRWTYISHTLVFLLEAGNIYVSHITQ